MQKNGVTLKDIVKVTIALKNLDDYKQLNELYKVIDFSNIFL